MSQTLLEPKTTPTPRVITTEPRFTDKVFRAVVTSGGLVSFVLLGLIGFFLIYNGFEAIRNAGFGFITGFDWVDAIPEENQPASYGIGAMLYGTIVTGILDADVYGHSIPRLMGMLDKRPTAIDQTFIPVENYGVKVVSMEMFKPERSDPVAYRGPLLHRVLEQLLSDAYWGDIDLLLLDLPPGTGDIAISLGQLIPGSEIIVVTTPQIAAAEVAERAGRIAHQIKQPVIGVIENMSETISETTGEKISIFGSGGGEETARRLSELVGADVPLLAKIPFNTNIREGGDAGNPLVLTDPKTKQLFDSILDKIIIRPKSLVGVRLNINT